MSVKIHLKNCRPKSAYYHNGCPALKSVDYNDGAPQPGWSPAKIVGGGANCSFICSICRGLPKYPYELKACGCCFCLDCNKSKMASPKYEDETVETPCPNCKILFLSREIISFYVNSKALFRIYSGIDVKCEYGCGHVNSTTKMVQHEMWECKRRPVICPNIGCTSKLPHNEMKTHLKSCEHRLLYCTVCQLPKAVDEKEHECVKELLAIINRMLLVLV